MFEPIKRVSASGQVMQQIQTRIFDGTYEPGDRLPPERELSQELGVNRTTLREALKKLEHMGLLSIRHGDGTRVLDYYANARIELLGSLLLSQAQFNPELIENLFDAREVVGAELARKATLHRTPEDLERLRDILSNLREAGEVSEVQDLELQFFYGLAEATKNIFYVFMINSIKPVYVEFRELYAATAREPDKVLRLQKAVVNAIEKGDEKLAARKMLLYLEYGKDQVYREFGLRA
jgi:GntR family transcriptional repressor for pyruvate dehydrogenase complex